MSIAVQLEERDGTLPSVAYTWDADTEILSAHLKPGAEASGLSGSVGLEGSDGSWLILDVNGGRINAVEVAVWPEVQERAALPAPKKIEEMTILIPAARSSQEVRSVEVAIRLTAEADPGRKTIHFKLGKAGEARTVRLAKDILIDLDAKSRGTGLWLLNVPPMPNSL